MTHSRDVNDELKTQNTGVRKSFVIQESQKGIRTDIIIKYGLILSGQLLNSDRREIWHRTHIKSAETVFYWKKSSIFSIILKIIPILNLLGRPTVN